MDQVKPALIKLSPEEIDKRFNNDNKNKSIPCQSETNNQTDLPQNAPYNPVQPNAMGNVTQYQYDQRYYASNPNSAMPPQNLSYNSILPNATENIRIDQYNQQLYSPQPDSVSLPQTSTSAENPVSQVQETVKSAGADYSVPQKSASQSTQPAAQQTVPASSRPKKVDSFTKTDTIVNNKPEELYCDEVNLEMYVITSQTRNYQKKSVKTYIDDYNRCYSVPESSSDEKTKNDFRKIADFIIVEAKKVKLDKGYSYEYKFNECIILICKSKLNGEFKVVIPNTEFENYRIKQSIEKRIEFTVFYPSIQESKLNKLLYNYIKSKCIKSENIIKYKPGFYLENDKWDFVSHDPNSLIESAVLKEAVFDSSEISFEEVREIIKVYQLYLNKNPHKVLPILFRMSALLRPPLKSYGYQCRKVLVISGCDSQEEKNEISACLQIYNRDIKLDEIYSLGEVKKGNIKILAHTHKEDVLVFNDTQLTSNYQQQAAFEKMTEISELFSNDTQNSVECQCAVISSRFMNLEIAEETCLLYNMNDCAHKKVQNEMKLHYDFDRVVVNYVKTMLPKFENRCSVITGESEMTEDFKYSSSEDTYKALSVCINIMKNIFTDYGHNSFSEKYYTDMAESVYRLIRNSEKYNEEDEIVNWFIYILNFMVNKDEVRLAVAESEDTSEDIPVIYVKNELLLLDMALFNEIVKHVPGCENDKDGIRLRKILAEYDLLKVNTGKDKYLYRAQIAGSEKRPYMIAVNKSVLDSEAVKKLPQGNKSVYKPINTDDNAERIKLGVTAEGFPVYWSIGKVLTNNHLFIRGMSGAGKTYLLLSIANQLHDIGKRVIIFDYAKPSGYDKASVKEIMEEKYNEDNFSFLSEATINDITNEERIVIVRTSTDITDKLLEELLDYCDVHKAKGKELYVIIDEALSMTITQNSSLGKAVLYGRKANLNILAASQFISGKGSKEKIKLLNQAALKIAMSLDNESIGEVAREIAGKDKNKKEKMITIMKKFKRGDAVAFGELEEPDNEVHSDRWTEFHATMD